MRMSGCLFATAVLAIASVAVAEEAQGTVSVRATDNDGWADALVTLFQFYSRTVKEGDVEKVVSGWNKVGDTTRIVGQFSSPVPPGRYKVIVQYLETAPSQSTETEPFDVGDKQDAQQGCIPA